MFGVSLPVPICTDCSSPPCGLLQLKVELACHCADFISNCLRTGSAPTVRSIAIHVRECGLLSVKMLNTVRLCLTSLPVALQPLPKDKS